MNTNLENKSNKVGEVRKQVKESIMEEYGGTVEIGYAGDWDFDDFTRELTRIETNYLGKTGEMDYYQFLGILTHIRNMYEKLHKGEGMYN